MKKLIILLFIFINLAATAQDDDFQQEPNPGGNIRQKINAARAAYITNRLQLTISESEKFWPVYNEYTQKRQEFKIQYRTAKVNGTDEKTLLDLHLKIKQQELNLEKDYSARLLTIISPQKLAQLRDAEQEFRKLLLRQIEQRQQQRGGGRQQLPGR